MTTLGSAKSICARRARDATNTLTSADTWEELLNSSRREFLGLVPNIVGWDSRAEINTVANQATLALPAGFTEYSLITDVWLVDPRLQLEHETWASGVIEQTTWVAADVGQPRIYLPFQKTIRLAPIPDAVYAIEVFFRGHIADVSDDAAEFPEPHTYHDAYIEGALERRMIDDENAQRATYHHNRFMEYVKLARGNEPATRGERYPVVVDDFFG